ncbi:MAG: hypothetical protein JRI97_12255, partial [Deltaproteobacteria bacterium]|nr:hypothetical protein [Deltaproteobacteria bacterium]
MTNLGLAGYPYFLVSGTRRAILVEGGPTGLVPRVLQGLFALGMRPDCGVVLHTHADHAAGLMALADKLEGFALAGTAESSRVLSTERIVARMAAEDAAYNGI